MPARPERDTDPAEKRRAPRLRNFAATLAVLSGSGQIAALWLRTLDEVAIVDALSGAVYLIIGIGLFGQSRFTLFLAIAVPLASIYLQLGRMPTLPAEWLPQLRLAADLLIIACSACVLWKVRR